MLFQKCFVAVVLLLCISGEFCRAQSIETHNNPVSNGKIKVLEGDTDRSDWGGIPWYETDEDDFEYSPVDISRVQIAHDSQNVYMHLVTLAWEVDQSWRVGTYIDTDQDNTTGYNGSYLAVGADVLLEGAATHEFTAESQSEWGWNTTADLTRDQTSMLDVEVAIPRDKLGNATAFDFLLFANNECCEFGLPNDVSPNGAASLSGEFFTYELGKLVLPGDFNNSGTLDLADVNQLNEQIASRANNAVFDLNRDNQTNVTDLDVWVRDLKKTWMGDSNLDGEFNSSDLVAIFQAGKFESDANALWNEGDWSGDRRFNSGDLVRAFQDGGFERGPRAAVSSVPEPSGGLLLLVIAAMAGARGRATETRQRKPSLARRAS